MKADTNKIDKVLAAIEDAAASGKDYTFDKFCREHNLYGEYDRERADGSVFICCPFHHENRPSLSIDEPNRRFKCFGCGRGNRYIDFLVEYDKNVLGVDCSVAKKVNELLRNDPELQARVGFNTVYQKELQSISSFQGVGFKKFSIKPTQPKTYLELSSWMLKQSFSTQVKIFAVSLMQQGLPAEIIYSQVKRYSDKPINQKKYSLEELNKE